MDRTRARELAAAAHRDGEPLRWFEELYAEHARGEAAVPWADKIVNPLLIEALAGDALADRSTLVVGCGLGDDAAWLASRGANVTAFDIAPTAVHKAADRFPLLAIDWMVADLLALPPEWHGLFDLVVEISTLQCLPPELRARGLAACVDVVAPGGELLAIARGRDPDQPVGTMPWPLTPDELRAVVRLGCTIVAFADGPDGEDPPVRRMVMRARRG